MKTRSVMLVGVASTLFFSCNDKTNSTPSNSSPSSAAKPMKAPLNPVVYFEIPVTDMQRATRFYHAVFGFEFESEIIDKNEMALLPFAEGSLGISGALAKGEIYKPTQDGVVIYFRATNIDATLKAATLNGGKMLYPKTSNGALGFVAEFRDTEGNRIALHQPAK